MTRIFVYGTLKTGGSNHDFLAGQRLLGAGRTRPEFRLHELDGYPGMIRSPAQGRSIEGEIWEVDPHCLARLDDLEGVGSGLYSREAIALLPPGDTLPVEAYLYLGTVAGRRELGTAYATVPPDSGFAGPAPAQFPKSATGRP
jgi:gamma-glutamylaminecyclotransferase